VPETARRVRGRIEAVMGAATVHHYRTGEYGTRTWRKQNGAATWCRSGGPRER